MVQVLLLTIMNLYKELSEKEIKGCFVGLVVANVPAFESATRCSPIDGLNLARIFPGKVNGSVTEKIAYWIGETLIKKTDYYIDLHSSGSDMEMPQMCGYITKDNASDGADLTLDIDGDISHRMEQKDFINHVITLVEEYAERLRK